MNTYYYCYSHPQKNFLIENGLRYVIKGIHPKSLKRYWVFERNEILDNKLNEWQMRKH